MTGAQKTLLSLYKTFKKFCDDNNICFFAVAGTALGAIRHHGFIPWDDDIDVGMPIKDYEKFVKLIKTSAPENIGFRESYWMGGKFHDKRTTIIDVRMLTHTEDYHGFYIDVFPVIGLPSDKDKREAFIADIESYATNSEFLEFYPEVSPFSKKEILDWRNYLLHAYDYDQSDKVAAFCYFMLDAKGTKNLLSVPFEDTTIYVSSSYDWDLTNSFGDYMTPPPKEQQQTHDEYHIADAKKPYSQYIEEYNALPSWVKTILDKKHHVEGEKTQYVNSLLYEREHQCKKTKHCIFRRSK